VKAGYITIVGRPNVGKSTLMNALTGSLVAIVTPKPQTTRHRILGIVSGDDYQFVFVDTPGIFKPRNELDRAMEKQIELSLNDADLLYYMIDIEQRDIEERILDMVNAPRFLLINKIDRIDRKELLPWIDEYSKKYNFDEIIPISALKGTNLDDLVETTKRYLPDTEPLFPPDYLSDRPERFFVAELIREKIFLFYGEEIPYSTTVEVEEMKDSYIRANIYVEKESQKGIIIGKKGEKLKKVATAARKSIEAFLGRKVYLEVWVKVRKNWRRNPSDVRRFGYYG